MALQPPEVKLVASAQVPLVALIPMVAETPTLTAAAATPLEALAVMDQETPTLTAQATPLVVLVVLVDTEDQMMIPTAAVTNPAESKVIAPWARYCRRPVASSRMRVSRIRVLLSVLLLVMMISLVPEPLVVLTEAETIATTKLVVDGEL